MPKEIIYEMDQYDSYNTANNEVQTISENEFKKYGKILTRSHLCSICTSKYLDQINLLRARDHKTYEEIVNIIQAPGITVDKLKKHFKNHFHINKTHSDIISLKEESSPESLEIVEKVLEGEIDIFSAGNALLDIKTKRLNFMMNRIEFLNAHLEEDSADDVDKQEFVSLNKSATELETSITKLLVILDKKLFPSTQEDLSNAVLQYKLKVLSKIIDNIQLTLIELEKNSEYYHVIQEVRKVLASKIGSIEDEILKSGGVMK